MFPGVGRGGIGRPWTDLPEIAKGHHVDLAVCCLGRAGQRRANPHGVDFSCRRPAAGCGRFLLKEKGICSMASAVLLQAKKGRIQVL